MPALFASAVGEFRQFRELSRLFVGRFLENDLLSPEADSRASVAAILALLAMPGLFYPLFEFMQFSSVPFCFAPLWVRDLGSMPDKAIYIGLSMTVLGITAVLEWDALLPDRRDVAVLRPLSIRLTTIFAAKVWALVRLWLVFNLLLNGVSLFFFPMAVIQKSSFDALFWFARAHLIAVASGSAFMFLSVVAIQGVLIAALGWRRFRQVAPYVQFALVAVLLVLFFYSIGVTLRIAPGRPASALMLAAPPVWFLGLYQHELGWMQPVFRDLASIARWGFLCAACLAGSAYVLSYRRAVLRSFEEPEGVITPPGLATRALHAAANRLLLRTPAERAVFHFVWNTVMRSRGHRVLIAMYAGVGFGLVFQSLAGMIAGGSRNWWQSPSGALVPVPLVLSVFLLSGLRYAFAVPAELRANWVFQIAGNSAPAEYLAGIRKAAILIGIVPLFSILAAIHVPLWGWRPAAVHVFYGALMAWLLLEAMLITMDKIPFTCSLVPGKANLKASWPLYIGGYLIFVAAFSALEIWIVRKPWHIWLFAIAVLGGKAGIGVWRKRRLADEFRLLYDEVPEPAVRTLDLAQ